MPVTKFTTVHQKKAAMIIGHPGHELRVHHWLETARPEVLVLTDGSGRTNHSRLASTTKVLQAARATPGPVYGRFTDAELYDIMLTGKSEVLAQLVKEVADWLLAGRFEMVAGDALEGYNTTHELCRHLIGAACERVRLQTGRSLANYDFLLVGRPDECLAELRPNAILLQLDDAAIARKLGAAENYPELKSEVENTLKQFGKAVFATEWLRPVANDTGLNSATAEKPFYETYGEKQKAAGYCENVIRFREHIHPLTLGARGRRRAPDS